MLKSTELRAMSAVTRQLEDIIGRENTTPKQLADIILKDVMLASRVLMVANSVTHNRSPTPGNHGSLTQAIVRIGFKSVRAICISVAIMDSLLKKMPHRQELQACIARSFDVAVHARNVAKNTGANQEDVFLAGLFQSLGELLFWSSSIPETQQYLELIKYTVDSPEQAFKKLSGMDFQDMSVALATEWQLSDLLLESFDVNITPDTKAVHLGRRISLASKHGWNSPEINKVLQSQLNVLGFDILEGMKFMRDGAEEAKTLAASYDLQTELPVESVDDTSVQLIADVPTETSPQKISSIKKPKATSLIRP